MKCRVCNREFIPEQSWYDKCDVCKLFAPFEYLEDYHGLLEQLRRTIALVPLRFDDDTTIGNKSTYCSWGLCSEALKRPGTRREKWHLCPMDRIRRRDGKPALGVTGCFYRCRVFNPVNTRPTKRQAQDLVEQFLEFGEPVVQYFVWALAKKERVYMPVGTSRVQADTAAAGIGLVTGDPAFAHTRLVSWDGGPDVARELIEEHDGEWMPFGT